MQQNHGIGNRDKQGKKNRYHFHARIVIERCRQHKRRQSTHQRHHRFQLYAPANALFNGFFDHIQLFFR